MTSLATCLNPSRLKKNGSARVPAKTLTLPSALVIPVATDALPVTNSLVPTHSEMFWLVSNDAIMSTLLAAMPKVAPLAV